MRWCGNPVPGSGTLSPALIFYAKVPWNELEIALKFAYRGKFPTPYSQPRMNGKPDERLAFATLLTIPLIF